MLSSAEPRESMPHLDASRAVLAVDTGSPLVSVAVAHQGTVLAEETGHAEHSSGELLRLIDKVLHRGGLTPGDLSAALGLRGPGSFTGLRVGFATLQGLRQALQIPVATLSSLEVLASLALGTGEPVTACVDALRGEWHAQSFGADWPPRPAGEPRLCTATELLAVASSQLIGFGVSRLRHERAGEDLTRLVEPGALASQALQLPIFASASWDPQGLTCPAYLRPPAVS